MPAVPIIKRIEFNRHVFIGQSIASVGQQPMVQIDFRDVGQQIANLGKVTQIDAPQEFAFPLAETSFTIYFDSGAIEVVTNVSRVVLHLTEVKSEPDAPLPANGDDAATMEVQP